MIVRRARVSGFAIVTGLFVVMMLYLSATIVMSLANQNLAFTRSGYASVKAHFLAHAAANLALAQLNSDASWEAAHGSRQSADVQTFPEGSFEAWVEKVDDTRVRLLGLGHVGDRTEKVVKVVVKRPAVTSIDYALEGLGARALPDVVFSLKDGENEWKQLPLPRSTFWGPDGTRQFDYYDPQNTKSRYAERLQHLAGDVQGNLYAVSRRAKGDVILRYDRAADDWLLLPAIRYPSNDPVRKGDFVRVLDGLAANGQKDLFALDQMAGADGIFHLDLEAYRQKNEGVFPDTMPVGADENPWKKLPLPPAVRWDKRSASYMETNDGKFSLNIQQIAADNQGNLYALSERSNPVLIYRYDAQSQSWSTLPAPSLIYFTQNRFNELVAHAPPGRYATNFVHLATDPYSGEVFGRYQRPSTPLPNGTYLPNISTIYHFYPASKEMQKNPLMFDGHWKADPQPPPLIKYTKDFEQEDAEHQGHVKSLAYNTVDYASNFLGMWPGSTTPDTVFRNDPNSREWSALPPVPVGRYVIDPKTREVVFQIPPDIFTRDITGLGGGGVERPGGGFQYVPTSTY